MTGHHRSTKHKLRAGVACVAHFANSFNFLVTWGLPVTIVHSTCIFCVYGMALYWPTLQFYVCVYVSCVCQYMAPLVSVITTLFMCCEYFPSSSVELRAFSALCVYSKFGHHPRPLGYLCAKFGFFHGLHCWASPWRKITSSINHSTSLFDALGTEDCTSEKSWWKGVGV